MTLRLALALALLTSVATAASVDFANQKGTLTGSNAGLSLTGSVLVGIIPSNGTMLTGDLGTLSFTTGSVAIGSLQTNAVLNSGGTFTISGNGTGGIPNGIIFAGTFNGPVLWQVITLANGTHNYSLTGTISGVWFTGKSVQGVTVQLTINTGKGFFNGTTMLSSGNTEIEGVGAVTRGVVPEPASLIMMGTGILSLAFKLRKKVVA